MCSTGLYTEAGEVGRLIPETLSNSAYLLAGIPGRCEKGLQTKEGLQAIKEQD